jgi:hypothetical protein
MIKFPFEVPFDEVQAHIDQHVSAVFSCLESEFLIMPKGTGFIDYVVFETGYEALKKATREFADVRTDTLLAAVIEVPVSFIVLRTILGFTPPEWAYVATQRTGVEIGQGFVRSLDRRIRLQPLKVLPTAGVSVDRIRALVDVASHLISEGAPDVSVDKLHRLNKADTETGIDSLRAVAELGTPYAMLLYERFLGRPFAGHRDSVSELVGDTMESAIETVLSNAGISYRKTKRAERLPGFDQAPDFIVPSEFNPQVIIEAKITEDDGTARDKITRVQHLGELSIANQPSDQPKYEVIACIGGRGFGVRREDMRKLIYATRGKVFTIKTLDRLIEYTQLRNFRSK